MGQNIKGKIIITNARVKQEAYYKNGPETSKIQDLRYGYLGKENETYIYTFATWETDVNEKFPPAINKKTKTDVDVTYWYKPELKNGGSQSNVYTYTLLIGDEKSEAVFFTKNPIKSVNGQSSQVEQPISTRDEEVKITAMGKIENQKFKKWIKISGKCDINNSTLFVKKGESCLAVACYYKEKFVYIPDAPEKISIEPKDILKITDIPMASKEFQAPRVKKVTPNQKPGH